MTRILQISDPHIMPEGQPLQGKLDTAAALKDMLAGLSAMLDRVGPVERILVTGDLTENGSAAAYRYFLAIMEDCPLPWRAIPGNHDSREAMRAGLQDAPWMPAQGPINWREDLDDLSLLGLDTLVEGADHGALSEETLHWLRTALENLADRPVLLIMHHPPIITGIDAMDRIGLQDRARLEDVLSNHWGPLQIGCGHVHRMMVGGFAGRQVTIAPGTSHAVGLDLRARAALGFIPRLRGAILHDFDRAYRCALITPEDFGNGVPFA